jgi:hypothetical protein
MPSTLLTDLQDQIAKGQAMVVVGAGVSIGATNGKPCASWQGLLQHGGGALRGRGPGTTHRLGRARTR